jgi:hypothetical protein
MIQSPDMKTNMNLTVNETSRVASGFYFNATADKTTATVAIHSWGVQVVCHNAANRVWRGGGRHFQTIAAALAGYKSGAMQAIIRAAGEANHAAVEATETAGKAAL